MIKIKVHTFIIFFFKGNTFFKAEEREKGWKRKHIIGALPCMGWRNALHHHEGGGETHPTLP